ncbi:5-hydroxytryptamine receptor 3C-like [Urocitellus parryii]
MPRGFLVATDALSFCLKAEKQNCAPFKMTFLLGYSLFLLMMNDLLPSDVTSPRKQHLVELWVKFSHLVDTLLFHLFLIFYFYLLFMASLITTVNVLWNT